MVPAVPWRPLEPTRVSNKMKVRTLEGSGILVKKGAPDPDLYFPKKHKGKYHTHLETHVDVMWTHFPSSVTSHGGGGGEKKKAPRFHVRKDLAGRFS